jgi:WD40 repeat protein
MRILVATVCLAILVAACGRVPGGPQASGDLKLYEAVSDRSQIAVIDSRSHTIERWLELGTPTRDWKRLYSVAGTSLNAVDPQTGAGIASLQLPGYYHLPSVTMSGMPGGLSQNGAYIVVESYDDASNGSASASHFLVIDTSLNSSPKRVDLKGYYTFDAISNDGGRLYLIEYVSQTDYRVRYYEVAAGQMYPNVIVDKANPTESMNGVKLSGVPSQDGGFLYSLYARQTGTPFIHALDLSGSPFAFCIDLPGSGSFGWSLAMSGDGSHLYAANAPLGVVSEINSDTNNSIPAVARSVHIDSGKKVAGIFAQDVQAKELGANAAVVSLDGKTLVTSGSSGIVWIDTAGLRVNTHALDSWTVWSLALSPDGNTLYVLSDSGMIAEVSMQSRQVSATFNPHAGNPMDLMRVAAA